MEGKVKVDGILNSATHLRRFFFFVVCAAGFVDVASLE